jgi:Tfp pilus assembly protein PilO
MPEITNQENNLSSERVTNIKLLNLPKFAKQRYLVLVLVVLILVSSGVYFKVRNQEELKTPDGQVLEKQYLDRNRTWEKNIKATVKELAEYHQQNGEYPNRIDIFADQLGIDAGELRVVYEYRVETDLQNYRLCVSLYGQDRLCYNRDGMITK